MENADKVQIISFYEFKDLNSVGELAVLREQLREMFRELNVRGTIILANEGYNGMVSGPADNIEQFVKNAGELFRTNLVTKSSFHAQSPFRKIDVKIKSEIVTLKKPVDISQGKGTHVSSQEWNQIISDPETVVLDARNDYEHKIGTFKRALNPQTGKFSDLPAFVAENLDPKKHKRVAMFCTGGIRCEKFAPYLKQMGFQDVFQLEGGILKYLEETPDDEMLWEGECFVFDERVTVDKNLQKGTGPDYSQRHANAKKPPYKVKE
ncbi:MAG: rhodanese-related sulfurtransferase [Pyrinomonadaceae bacterium]